MTFTEQGDGGAGGAHRGLMEGLWESAGDLDAPGTRTVEGPVPGRPEGAARPRREQAGGSVGDGWLPGPQPLEGHAGRIGS